MRKAWLEFPPACIRLLLLLGFGALATTPLRATTTTYSDVATFTSQLGSSVTDNYSNPGYFNASQSEISGGYIYSNTYMDSVLGETQYVTTGFTNWNILLPSVPGGPAYCAGCNGSFDLIFTSTTVGTAAGVYGAGFELLSNANYYAYVTFGDGSTANYVLPTGSDNFWGITSGLDIQSIDIGLSNGGATTDGLADITDLTIGSEAAPTPEPSSVVLWLTGAGLVGLVVAARKRIARGHPQAA